MQRLEGKIAALASTDAVTEAVAAEIARGSPKADAAAAAYATKVCQALAMRRCFNPSEWAKADAGRMPGGAAAVAAALETARSMSTVEEEEEEEDDAEQLCDCTFTLAYGTKILLHNTQLKLKRGYKYGLLGARRRPWFSSLRLESGRAAASPRPRRPGRRR